MTNNVTAHDRDTAARNAAAAAAAVAAITAAGPTTPRAVAPDTAAGTRPRRSTARRNRSPSRKDREFFARGNAKAAGPPKESAILASLRRAVETIRDRFPDTTIIEDPTDYPF